MSFKKVRPRKVSSIAAEQIVDAIQRGDYPISSKLPSEFELAEQMGVSRPSIREALSALQAMAIIESRPGSGNYVLRKPSSSEESATVHLIESEAGCLEVMEARGVLEPPIAALVASKASGDIVAQLREPIDDMRECAARDDFDAYFDADKRFHIALADATGNALVSAALAPLLDTMDQRVYREFTRHYYLKNVDDIQHVVDLHSEILGAIEVRDGETAFAKTVEHWDRMREIWEA
ncbi:FadR family transcriptional regulator [Candidatus Bipolaricaulota bacterium]|nr:FadR family transcriptional regulator [Candidatus Bipolaricaulota bacterium]TFH09403.1 MAG: FadR family transcriptional regulator [Candidatus Atribacteria bacterium]